MTIISQFYHPFVKWYNNRLLALTRKFFLIPDMINEFMALRNISLPA
jgi:hypothetical protein